MVFSFFKKPPEKMVAKPAAVFRNEERGGLAPVAEAAPGQTGQESAGAIGGVAAEQQDDDLSLDFTDFDFDRSLRDLQVAAELDPIASDVEQAAVLYADGHDDAARSLLEDAVRVHRFGPGERLWLMLFDFYWLTGHQAAFEALAVDYAQCFGQCSPSWRDGAGKREVSRRVGQLLFKGGLTGDNDDAFDALRAAMERNPGLCLDLSKVTNLDSAGCGRLLTVLQKAHKARREIELLGGNILRPQLESRVQPGRAEGSDCWLMLLELYQRLGEHALFEELAIDYAVTFEISPPSWEARPTLAAKNATDDIRPSGDDTGSGVYFFRDGIRAARFTDLAAFSEVHNPVIIDCLKLSRIDFTSAGALFNVLNLARRTGKKIIFRYPNHLVAELFGVVGLNAVADIVLAEI